MARRASGRTVRVLFQLGNPTRDEYNEPVGSWDAPTELGAALAKVFRGRGSERREAAMEQGQQTATFQVPATNRTRSVTLQDRIFAEQSAWDIEDIAIDTPKRGSVEFTATRAR